MLCARFDGCAFLARFISVPLSAQRGCASRDLTIRGVGCWRIMVPGTPIYTTGRRRMKWNVEGGFFFLSPFSSFCALSHERTPTICNLPRHIHNNSNHHHPPMCVCGGTVGDILGFYEQSTGKGANPAKRRLSKKDWLIQIIPHPLRPLTRCRHQVVQSLLISLPSLLLSGSCKEPVFFLI